MYKVTPSSVISRLPRYYSYVGNLLEEGREKVSSRELSIYMNSSSSQVRQDLNFVGNYGTQGYGYRVEYLHAEIGNAIGVNRSYGMIIVGAGHLGQALAHYTKFDKYGFTIKGLFDRNPQLFGLEINRMPIQYMDYLEAFIHENGIQIAALTVPEDDAPDIANRLVLAGIQAIWNFSNTDLDLPENVVVENVHLSDSLMKLSYQEKERSGEEN